VKVSELREALKSDNVNDIKRKTEDLQNAFHALSQQLYAQQDQQQADQQAQGAPDADSTPPGNGRPTSDTDEGEVVEGEFTEA
jgi:molecular chaperone DnaK